MKCFIVLGMHRSATSLTAKGLHKCNVHMGDRLLGKHPSNPYGHYEDIEMIALNDCILRHAGGSWDHPPSEKAILSAGRGLSDTLKQAIELRQRDHEFWGWKDPRTSLTIRCWLPYIENPHFIINVRQPIEVARSLLKRDDMPIKEGLALAGLYNRRIIRFYADWSNSNFLAATS
jgi:hypothetical protein